MRTLADLDTPSLLLDRTKLLANIAFAQDKCKSLGVLWRPHLKTHKCLEIARLQAIGETRAITVSTLKEAEIFSAAGFKDIIYAVGIAPHKLPRVDRLNRLGADVKIVLDNVAAARSASEYCRSVGSHMGVLIEIDCDGHRSGVSPEDKTGMLEIASALTDGARLVGVLTHAGGSYNERSIGALTAAAQAEVRGINVAAQLLRDHGYQIDIVSVGSTPTLTYVQDAAGVTEYRSGVGTFQDLVMAGLGVCRVDDLAASVLVTVIGHQEQKGWILTDGGWLAMSRDRGTAGQSLDCGYGLVCDMSGKVLNEYWMSSANQEHGIISRRDGAPIDPEEFPVGTRLRILPNHACPTAAAFDRYYVIEGEMVTDVWKRFNNWE